MSGKEKGGKATPGNTAEIEDAKSTRIRFSLETLGGCIKEICKVYREMRADQLDHGKGRSLVWVLSQLRAALEAQALERLEQRLEELAPSIEGKANGYTSPSHPSRTAH